MAATLPTISIKSQSDGSVLIRTRYLIGCYLLGKDAYTSDQPVVLSRLAGAAAGSVCVGFPMPFQCSLADLLETVLFAFGGRRLVLGFLYEGDHLSHSLLRFIGSAPGRMSRRWSQCFRREASGCQSDGASLGTAPVRVGLSGHRRPSASLDELPPVGNDDPALGFEIAFRTSNDDAVMEGPEFHRGSF